MHACTAGHDTPDPVNLPAPEHKPAGLGLAQAKKKARAVARRKAEAEDWLRQKALAGARATERSADQAVTDAEAAADAEAATAAVSIQAAIIARADEELAKATAARVPPAAAVAPAALF